MPPCIVHSSSKPSARFWGQPAKHANDGFEAQTTKLATSSVLHTHLLPLDVCHRRPRLVGRQVLLSLARLTSPVMTRSTRSLSCIYLRLSIPRCVASHSASWFLGPSFTSAFHYSRFIGTTRLYLTFTLSSTTVSKLDTYRQETFCTTQLTLWVSHQLNLDRGLQSNYKDIYQPCVRTM